MERRESFVFYRSFLESIEEAQPEEQLQLYRAIALYALNQEDPQLKGLVKGVWLAIKPQLDANFKRYINGKKGGAPRGNSNARKQPKNNQKQPNVNDNVNVNVNGSGIRGTMERIPTLEKVRLFFKSHAKPGQNHEVMSFNFFNTFRSVDWHSADNKPVENWQAMAMSWINSDNKSNYDNSGENPWNNYHTNGK